MSTPSKSYPLILLGLFLVWSTFLAIRPVNRSDWLLENVLVIIGILLLFLSYKRFQFSHLSYTLIFIFLCSHEIGSHYTYAEVPYENWFKSAINYSLNAQLGWERNHYDRLVHFLWGLLFFLPAYEISIQVIKARGIWSYLLPLGFMMSSSLIYEEIEWAAASIFGGELGMTYLGIQGDIWDAHKDSLMAIIGALLAMMIMKIALLNRKAR